MDWLLRPWHLTILALASWMNREQHQVIQYLETENAILREKLGKRRILFNDDQRRRLAIKGKELGRKGLSQISTLFTPDTILRWHRELVARKWDYSGRCKRMAGRPRLRPEIAEAIVRMAKDNASWGYDRIQGALKNIGYHISDTTVGNVLRGYGIEPVPQRGRYTNWTTFLRAHWEGIGAIDFTTTEVWTRYGLQTYYVLVAMQLSTRRVQICGVTPTPNATWVQQMGRNLTDYVDGFLRNTRYLLLGRDTKFYALRGVLENTETEVLLLPPRSPNLNAYVERFMRSMKSEYLDKMIFFGETSLRRALMEFEEHYHAERNHQGLGNKIIQPGPEVGRRTDGEIHRRERLGGMLSYYYREAA